MEQVLDRICTLVAAKQHFWFVCDHREVRLMGYFLRTAAEGLGPRPILARIHPTILDAEFETAELGRGSHRSDGFLHASRVHAIDLANDFLLHVFHFPLNESFVDCLPHVLKARRMPECLFRLVIEDQ